MESVEYPSPEKSTFSVADARVIIYAAGDDFEPVDSDNPEYLGPQCHTVQAEEQASRRKRYASGVPFSDSSLEDFETRLTIDSEWMHQSRAAASVDTSRMPSLSLRQRYVIVVIWFNARKNAYVKRVFFNCWLVSSKVDPANGRYVSGYNFMASWSQQEVQTVVPDRTAELSGVIKFAALGGSGAREMYAIRAGSATLLQLVPTADLPSTLQVLKTTGGTYGEWELKIKNTRVARWYEESGEQVLEVQSFVEGSPRLRKTPSPKVQAEFWIGNLRTMVITEDGIAYAPQWWEDGQPTGAAAFAWWFLHLGTAATSVRLREVAWT